MEIQLTLEKLATLFFAIEGLSLWQIPHPTTSTLSDINDDICDKILKSDGSPDKRIKDVINFRLCRKIYKFFHSICVFLCSHYPLIWFSVLLLSFYWLSEIMKIYIFEILPVLMVVYILFKLFCLWITKRYAKKYDDLYTFVNVEFKLKDNNGTDNFRAVPNQQPEKSGKSRTSGKTGKSRKK